LICNEYEFEVFRKGIVFAPEKEYSDLRIIGKD
jgi:hypothetical protein